MKGNREGEEVRSYNKEMYAILNPLTSPHSLSIFVQIFPVNLTITPPNQPARVHNPALRFD
jgi:hypothetical protein